ncbi:MAG: NADAR domain-containing protein [bacterium]|nr:NADAR domain-containing protein [bacterium]
MPETLACVIPASLAVRYRMQRVRAGQTTADVAAAAKCSVSLVEAVEAGTATLEQATVMLLNPALGVSRDEVVQALHEHAGTEQSDRRLGYQFYAFALLEATVGSEGTMVWQGETHFRGWCAAHGHDPHDARFQPLLAHLRVDDERQGRSVRFYRPQDPHGCCSNYSLHAVTVDGLAFMTSEHYYQWYKHLAVDAAYAELIRLAPTPGQCWRLANDRSHPQRPDWEQIKDDVMRLVVLHKFVQHEDCRRELLATGDLMLIEASPRDSYWGEGDDRTGKNMLGVVLMEVRGVLHAQAEYESALIVNAGGCAPTDDQSPVAAYEHQVRARLAVAR